MAGSSVVGWPSQLTVVEKPSFHRGTALCESCIDAYWKGDANVNCMWLWKTLKYIPMSKDRLALAWGSQQKRSSLFYHESGDGWRKDEGWVL